MVFLLAAAGPASAGTCNNPAPPYEVPAQNSVVNLDIDCAGAGGIVEVIGTVNGNAGHALSDASGNEANWAIV
ncbi:MAG TPA: hypothetical protein VLA37_01165, partial [Sphingomonadaceae bacterium]|nr:hypothetical protein [Sphingomonadaceae bacterium]